MTAPFLERYGPWALVAGASEGLGEAFVRALAARGLNVLALARREAPLVALAEELSAKHQVEVRPVVQDLAAPNLAQRVAEITQGLDVGLLVHNAAFANIGRFLERPLDSLLMTLDVGCRAPVILSRLLAEPMAARGRGGVVLMSSLAGTQGSAYLATYAATKAFNLILAEGLWDELGERGVDVLACRAGATRTPGFESTSGRYTGAVMEPAEVVEDALSKLGRGPGTIPGVKNKLSAFALTHFLSRRAAARIMGKTTRKIYEG